jgi:hypothetical protein
MKSFNALIRTAGKTVAAAICAASLNSVAAGDLGPTVDDFGNTNKNSLGFERQFINDTVTGGQTKAQHRVEKGVLFATGEIVPPRGQPGWASIVLLLDPKGLPQDASAHEGIRLRVRVIKGNLSISANSSEIKNFDYHAAPVTPPSDGKFHVVNIPFAQLKRAWSAQTPLNPKTLISLSLVAFDVQKGAFDFEIDEVRFY